MTWSGTHNHSAVCCRRPNALALLIAAGAFTFVHVNVDPTTAGSDPAGALELSAIDACPPPPPLPESIKSANGSQSAAEQSPNVLTGRWAMLMQSMILEKGMQSFGENPDYTATLHKQERLGGKLGEVQTVQVKLRHEPFSVYMKWLTFDKGRELIYIEGENDGKILVQPGGWKGRLTGTLALDPTGHLAMSESRHPPSEAGLVRLAETLLSYNRKNLKTNRGWTCEMHDNQSFQGRDCYLFITTYDSPDVSEIYRKSVQYIDKELSLPIVVKNYTWDSEADVAKIDESTLIESYTWTDIRVDQRLANADFDETNSSYRFQQR
ncbi:MAG: DUF1571 domain-containing protein [Planctomycetaceae bacterium]|nr:DUF1571 domain-containing protein [Planctomycetaceae bacterium]